MNEGYLSSQIMYFWMLIDDIWQLLIADHPLFLTVIGCMIGFYVFIVTSITFSLTLGHRWQEGLSSFPSTRDPLVINKSEKTQSNPF